MRKAAGIGAVAGAAWAAPSINGMSIVPTFAAAASTAPIVMTGTATKTLGCFGPGPIRRQPHPPDHPRQQRMVELRLPGLHRAQH
jgi:hypothetical protein